MFLLTKIALPWRTLYALYSGILGKSLLIISLSTPVALIYNTMSLIPPSYPVILFGALLSLIGYIFTEISVPALVRDFKNSHHYSTEILKNSVNIEWVSEFKILESDIENLSKVHDGYCIVPLDFKSIENTKTLLGEDKAIRSLCLIKYNYCNIRDPIKRLVSTLTLTVSLLVIFSSTIANVFKIIIG